MINSFGAQATVAVFVKGNEQEGSTITLPLVYERGNWYVDNFIIHSDPPCDTKSRFREYADNAER